MPGIVLDTKDATECNKDGTAGVGAENKQEIISNKCYEKKIKWGAMIQSDWVAILDGVVGKSFSEEMAFELRFEWQERSHNTKIWRKNIQERGNS